MTVNQTQKTLNQSQAVTVAVANTGSFSTVSTTNGFIFPYIQIQNGRAENLEIGSLNPTFGNFTDLTASTVNSLSNVINLGDLSNPVHGVQFGTSFFGVSLGRFVYNGPAQFTALQLSGSSLSVSNGDLLIEPPAGGQVVLPRDTVCYNPSVEHLYTAGDNVLLTNANVSFIHSTASGYVFVQLPTPTIDGFLKTIVMAQGKAEVQVNNTLVDPMSGGTGSTVLTLEQGFTFSFIYSTVTNVWYVHGNSGNLT